MHPKAFMLLLLVLNGLPSFSQSLDSLPSLKKVFSLFEGNFQTLKGEQKPEHLPMTVYSSILSIEGTLENEIVESSGEYAAYFASLGNALNLKNAKTIIEKWKPLLDKLLGSGYSLENNKMGPTLGKDYIGYQYSKNVVLQFYTVDLYYLKTEKKGIYQAGISFTKAKGEIK